MLPKCNVRHWIEFQRDFIAYNSVRCTYVSEREPYCKQLSKNKTIKKACVLAQGHNFFGMIGFRLVKPNLSIKTNNKPQY